MKNILQPIEEKPEISSDEEEEKFGPRRRYKLEISSEEEDMQDMSSDEEEE